MSSTDFTEINSSEYSRMSVELRRAFPKLCEECGLKRLKLHELRHTNFSLLLSEGATMKEVQDWAGHSNYSVTANTYAHILANSKNKLTDSISSLLA